jgi:hypothetical protein
MDGLAAGGLQMPNPFAYLSSVGGIAEPTRLPTSGPK